MIYRERVVAPKREVWPFVKKVMITLAAAACCALLYVRFAPDRKPPARTTALQPKILALSTFVDAHIDHIFSPLDGQVPPMPQQELLMLREAFVDGARVTLWPERPIYVTASQLCDVLLLAIRERERANTSLADSRSKAHGVALSQDPWREHEERARFFEGQIFERWAKDSKSYRERTVQLYSRLREQERQFIVAATK